jgi:hypothetical protein
MKKTFILSLLRMTFSVFLLFAKDNNAFAETEVKKWTVEETIQKVRDAGFHEALYNYGNLFLGKSGTGSYLKQFRLF